MGQKVSPISFRLGITQHCRSRWYARKKEYGKFAVEDDKIRKFIKKNYAFAGIPLIEIERTPGRTTVIVHTARPGVMIGRRGATVEKLTDELNSLTDRNMELKFVEVPKPELSAQLVAEVVAQDLEKRLHYRRIMHQTAGRVMEAGAQGVKIQLAGRIGGIEIARTENISLGRMPLHTLRADIDYGFAEAIGNKGKVGVKVWIFKGEILPEDKNKPVPQAGKEKVDDKTSSGFPVSNAADTVPKKE